MFWHIARFGGDAFPSCMELVEFVSSCGFACDTTLLNITVRSMAIGLCDGLFQDGFGFC